MSKSKKVKNRHRGWQFTYTGTRPRWTYKNQIWHAGSRRRCNHLFQILSNSVKGFPCCEGPKNGGLSL